MPIILVFGYTFPLGVDDHAGDQNCPFNFFLSRSAEDLILTSLGLGRDLWLLQTSFHQLFHRSSKVKSLVRLWLCLAALRKCLPCRLDTCQSLPSGLFMASLSRVGESSGLEDIWRNTSVVPGNLVHFRGQGAKHCPSQPHYVGRPLSMVLTTKTRVSSLLLSLLGNI